MLQPLNKTLVFWSSGKDSCLALHRTLKLKHTGEVGLISTLSKNTQRTGFHGTPMALLEAQAQSLGLPLTLVELPEPCPNKAYEKAVLLELSKQQNNGLTQVVFGDLFLEDIRQYRENFISSTGLSLSFPLWGENTGNLAKEFLQLGFKAVVCAVNPAVLSNRFLGRAYDESFLQELSPSIDPAGENGEFHTFVVDGPLFKRPLKIKTGAIHMTPGCHWIQLD